MVWFWSLQFLCVLLWNKFYLTNSGCFITSQQGLRCLLVRLFIRVSSFFPLPEPSVSAFTTTSSRVQRIREREAAHAMTRRSGKISQASLGRAGAVASVCVEGRQREGKGRETAERAREGERERYKGRKWAK